MKNLLLGLVFVIYVLSANDAYIKQIHKSCQNNQLDACFSALKQYRKEIENDAILWEVMIEQYTKLCKKNYAKACFSLGIFYGPTSIKAISLNLEKSAYFYQKGCDLGDMRACNNLGVMYQLGMYVEKDYQKAFELFQKACKHGDHEAVDKACSSQQKLAELLKRQDQ